ncbi:MAG TPA: hypothetical protein VI814_08530 [Candidatus Limnocylindria bacterium]
MPACPAFKQRMALAGTAAFGQSVADELVLSIINDQGAVRSDAHGGTFARPLHVVAAPAGLAFLTERSAEAYRWMDVREVTLRRHSLVVRTESTRERIVPTDGGGAEIRRTFEEKTRVFRLVVDDVEEESLSALFARVLGEMKDGGFSYNGTAWHEYQNAIERLEHEFAYQDDHVLPAAAGGLWVALGLLATILVASALNVTSARAVPPDTFTLSHRVAPYDPRAIIAGFAISALLTGIVLRVGLGRQATVWIRGAARGWHHGSGRVRRTVIRSIGRVLLSASTASAVLLLALLAYWPSIASTVLIDEHGLHDEVLLPFVSLDHSWRDVMQIERVATSSDPNDRAGVLIRFIDGSTVTTVGNDLGGGTEGQLYQVALSWWKAALR